VMLRDFIVHGEHIAASVPVSLSVTVPSTYRQNNLLKYNVRNVLVLYHLIFYYNFDYSRLNFQTSSNGKC